MSGIPTPQFPPPTPQKPDGEVAGLATASLLQGQGQNAMSTSNLPAADAPPHANPVADAEPSDEDAIASYMAELLARSNPGGAPAATPAPQSAAPAKPVTPVLQSPSEPSADAETEIVQKPRTPVAPPERRDDLALMRELANSNAKSALETYSSCRMVGTTQGRFTIAAVAIALSIVLAIFSSSVTSFTFIGAVVCLTVGVLWTSRYLILVRHLKSLLTLPARPAVGAPSAAVPTPEPQPAPTPESPQPAQ